MKKTWIYIIICALLCSMLVGCDTGDDQPTETTEPTGSTTVVAGAVTFRVYLNETHISTGKTTNIVPVVKRNNAALEVAVSFHVADTNVASVDENGVVTALTNGSTAITAKCSVDGEEYTAETVLYVEDNVGISILQEKLQPALGGDSVRANYSIYYNGETVTSEDVSWEIGDTAVANVDASGNVSAVALGETTLTLRYKTLEATIPVCVDTKCISTVAEFMAIRDNMDLNYILTNDIDFAGVKMTFGFGDEDPNNRKAFTGTLDGNGYALKNVVIGDGPAIRPENKDKTFTIFAENRGTIKNIMFDVEWPTTANVQTRIGIVHNNYGTVENVAFTGKIYANSYWDSGAFSLVNQNYGTMRNCVAVLDVSKVSVNKDNWINLTNRQGQKESRIENCVLVVLGSDSVTGTLASIQDYNNGSKFTLGGFFAGSNGVISNSFMYDGANEFFSSGIGIPNGFGSEWILDRNILYFGDEVVLKK